MGYTHRIGEACFGLEMSERRARIEVDTVHLDGDANWFCSGYNEWTDFTRRTGLHRVFFGQMSCEYDHYRPWWIDDEGKGHNDLIYTTQYAAPLTEAHYRAFAKAKEAYPEWPTTDVRKEDMAKLDFLIKWTRWALDNCDYPTYYND